MPDRTTGGLVRPDGYVGWASDEPGTLPPNGHPPDA